jgi:ribosomal protein L11 methyltransferase
LKWLEVSLTVNGELAEAVADVLSRYAPNGVALQPEVGKDEFEPRAISNHIKVLAYLPVDDAIQAKREGIDHGLWHLSQIQPLPSPAYRFIEEEDWSDLWKENYKPIPIGEKLLILPAWYPPPEGKRKAIILDPGMAFGTGLHPTTQLCLAAMEDHLTSGSSVVDLGCGSGILSIAAILLGARTVLAVDTDPIAVQNAQMNIERNGMIEHIRVEEGSLQYLLDDEKHLDLPDLLLANIYATILDDLIDTGLLRAVRPQGIVILSGIMKNQTDSIQTKCESLGAEILENRQQGDWVALVLQTHPAEPRNSP